MAGDRLDKAGGREAGGGDNRSGFQAEGGVRKVAQPSPRVNARGADDPRGELRYPYWLILAGVPALVGRKRPGDASMRPLSTGREGSAGR